MRDEAHGVRSFVISRLDGQPFDPYEPGAHIDVACPSGVTRPYPLCGDPARRDSHLFAVKREASSRGGSRSLHDNVQIGTELSVGAPRSLFRLAEGTRKHVLIGACIDITPLLSMAYGLVALGAPFELHYFARSAERAAFLPLLSRAAFEAHVTLQIGIEPAALDAYLSDVPQDTHVYTCGPVPFMDHVVAVGEARVPADAIHLERFAAEPQPASRDARQSFDVQLASTGQTVRMDSSTSIVEATRDLRRQIASEIEHK